MKYYGPYTRKDGRAHTIIVHPDGRKQTQSYPRFLMEQKLGRSLLPSEHIDHVNNDPTDNRIENLQILSQRDNNRKAAALSSRKLITFTCPCCGKETTKYLNHVKGNSKKGRKGPYCSRSCAGKDTYVNPWK